MFPGDGAHPASHSVEPGSLRDPDSTCAGDQVIVDINDLPCGEYLPFGGSADAIPSSFTESFAVLRTGVDSGVVLTAAEANRSHNMFELGRRLRMSGCTRLEYRLATQEIVKATHSRFGNREFRISRDSATHFERAGWQLLDLALHAQASDIHVETRTDHANVFFRIHGERVAQPSMSRETALGICSALYTVHGDANNKETVWSVSKPLDTVIHHVCSDGREVQVRMHTAPIHPEGNCQCVMRLLVMDGQASRPLEEVGYTPMQCDLIEEMLVGATGLVLLVGPTNSGKSTSIQSFIHRIYQRRGPLIKLVTVEDPVEYLVESACQMAVPRGRKELQDGTGSIYNTLLTATLREDPDVVMIGEVRGTESARAVKDLVLAGRKILSTLHAYEAFATYARLREMGVPESLLTMRGFISGIIYQRLVPILCARCSIPLESGIDQGLIRDGLRRRLSSLVLPDDSDVHLRSPTGCPACEFKGIVGRTPCAEVLVPDEEFLTHMRLKQEAAARAAWHCRHSSTIGGLGAGVLSHAIEKMCRGLVDPRDIEVQIGPLPEASAP
jgi:type II secretory ATPase GspE/PulE/Tfp pilus assembly ATPase PilB-like protein